MGDRTDKQPPGKVETGTRPEVLRMICTAGHVDHGKTKLVKLLTGCNTDRLKAELERGLTIELGFAPCFLGGDLCVGIVDVPGHDKFIKNMVAGVSGIDMAVLVIAANDGIMPQTVEHLQILELLGVSKGIVALTKTDLVDEKRIHSVTGEIRDFITGTFLERATICPVSSETFDGYSEFYTTLVREIKGLAKKRRYGIFRMPIEQVFTRKGYGTVVQGIPVDGTISIGSQVEVVPGNQRGKVRAVQQFMNETSEGEYGQCLALNIPDFNKKPPERGQVICLPGYIKPSVVFHVRLTMVHDLQKPLQNAEEIKFHTGTIEEPGKIYLLDNTEIPEGNTGIATIVLNNPVVAAARDRFIIRRPSPAATIAGGEILEASQSTTKPRKKQIADMLRATSEFFLGLDLSDEEGVEKRIEYYLRTECNGCASHTDISKGTLLTLNAVKNCLSNLVGSGKVLTLDTDYYIHSENYRSCMSEVESQLEKAVSEDGILSITISGLRRDVPWPDRLWKRIQEDLQEKKLVKRHGDRYIVQAAVRQLDTKDSLLIARIQELYEDAGFHSPRPDELPELLHESMDKIEMLLEYLYTDKKLVRLARNVVLSYDHFRQARDMVIDIINGNGQLDSADFKRHIGSSRKYALAILDFLDSQRITIRQGNIRKLSPNYEKYVL